MLVVYKSTTSGSSVRLSQQVYDLDTQEIYMRTASGSTWDAWSLVTYPTAMRQYQTLSSLANALGVFKQKPQLADGGSVEYYVGDSALGFVKTESGDKACVFLKSYSRIFIIGGDTDLFADSDVAGKYCITGAGATITIKNNSGSANTFRILSVVHND